MLLLAVVFGFGLASALAPAADFRGWLFTQRLYRPVKIGFRRVHNLCAQLLEDQLAFRPDLASQLLRRTLAFALDKVAV